MAGNVPGRAGRGGETHMNLKDVLVVILATNRDRSFTLDFMRQSGVVYRTR